VGEVKGAGDGEVEAVEVELVGVGKVIEIDVVVGIFDGESEIAGEVADDIKGAGELTVECSCAAEDPSEIAGEIEYQVDVTYEVVSEA
jgi:hypothetical protein